MLTTTLPRLAALFTALALVPTASANKYEVFIEIENEQDLYDLLVEQQIGEDTFNTLHELLQRGIDLNRANRAELYSLPNLSYTEVDQILAYRADAGFITDPAALVINGVLTEQKLGAIAPFLLVSQRQKQTLGSTSGRIIAGTRYSAQDDNAPPVALRGRLDTLGKLRVGVAVTATRNRLGDVVYDPNRNALTADPVSTQPQLAKLYAHWTDHNYEVVVGTYRIGFGQRLTFDSTDQIDPSGFYGDDELFRGGDLTRRCKESAGELPESPCTGAAGDEYITPDYSWRPTLLGAAVGLKDVPVGPTGKLSAHAFGSYQPKSIYQYELYDRGMCADPRDDDNDACSAPQVFRTQEDPFMPTSRFSFHTLPNMYAELLGGGNVTYKTGRRSAVGVTGYGSYVNWLVEGIDLDFQEWSRTPFGGPFGAVGVNGHYGWGINDMFAEVTRSFDSQTGGGGGFGALLRNVTTFGKHEIESSARYYDDKFANPYARPISAADEFDGLRARDEVGVRVRSTSTFQKRFNLRTSVDLWRNLEEDAIDGLLYVRGDIKVNNQFSWGLWTQYQNKDFGRSGRDQCFEVSTENDENGEPIPCAGEKYQATARARYTFSKALSVSAQYQHELLDEGRYDDQFRQDSSASLIITGKPMERVRLRGRVRYLFEDIDTNDSEEQSIWAYIDLTYRLRLRDRLKLRYDYFQQLDDRASTADREPNPEHWFWAEYEARF